MRRLSILVLALLFLAVPTVVYAATAEQRCTDLGSACICSEPLDFSAAVDRTWFDPPDTEGAGAKECMTVLDGQSLANDSATRHLLNRITGASIGLPGVAYVLETPAYAGSNGSINDNNRTMTGKTWCARHYKRYSPDHEYPCNDEAGDPSCPVDRRVKGPRNQKPQGGAHTDMQASWAIGPNGAHLWECQGGFGTPFGNCTSTQVSGDSIGFEDCKGAWCRIEYCFDHNSSTGALALRGRVTVLDPNENVALEQTRAKNFLDSNSTFITGETTAVASWWTQNISVGTQYTTHIMVASTSRNPNFWIGAASEIEEDSGPTPTPTATPTATPTSTPTPTATPSVTPTNIPPQPGSEITEGITADGVKFN